MNKYLFEKKEKILRRLSKMEVDRFKSINTQKVTLLELLELVKNKEGELWKQIKKDYKLTEQETKGDLRIDHETRHLIGEVEDAN